MTRGVSNLRGQDGRQNTLVTLIPRYRAPCEPVA